MTINFEQIIVSKEIIKDGNADTDVRSESLYEATCPSVPTVCGYGRIEAGLLAGH